MINKQTISFPFDTNDMQTLVAYSGSYPEYIGRARPGALPAAAEWQIRKVTYDTNFNVTAIQFAGGVNDYSKVWDDRATYSYA